MKTLIKPFVTAVFLTAAITGFPGDAPMPRHDMKPTTQGTPRKYENVNGLKMYYEDHGNGQPLLLLHGSFGTVEGWGTILHPC